MSEELSKNNFPNKIGFLKFISNISPPEVRLHFALKVK